MSTGKPIPRAEAEIVAYDFIERLRDVTGQIMIVGSIRRGKDEVHDIEILAEPKFYYKQQTLFDTANTPGKDATDLLYERLVTLFHDHVINRDRPRNDAKSNPFGHKYYRINYNYHGNLSHTDDPGDYDKSAFFTEYPIDLFVVIPPAQWGMIELIRTGSADYTHWFVQQGYQYDIKVRDGHLEKSGVTINTPTEQDVYRAMHLNYKEPKDREIPQ